MKTRSGHFRVLAPLVIAGSVFLAGAPSSEPAPDLSWLSGFWKGTFDGAPYQETYSTIDGGTMLWTGKVMVEDRVAFFEFGTIQVKEEGVFYTPYPAGKKSESFRLVERRSTPSPRLVFENKEHDFPTRFTYELIGPDRLRVTISGPRGEAGKIQVVELSKSR